MFDQAEEKIKLLKVDEKEAIVKAAFNEDQFKGRRDKLFDQ